MKIKKRLLYWILAVLIAGGLGIVLIRTFSVKDLYQFTDNSFSYSARRGRVSYTQELIEEKDTFKVCHVSFPSRPFYGQEITIHALLYLPVDASDVPGIVLLPGGSVKKEQEATVSELIVRQGIAVLVLDQRGIGETGGQYLPYDQDYRAFQQGVEPMQHLVVYDALRAADVLRRVKGVDKTNIGIVGASMGGRYALIAAAIDRQFKGVIGISTSGFHVPDDGTQESSYLQSIDPDHYISRISPRPVIILHGTNDTVVSLEDAQKTFALAGDPKDLFIAEGCGHGYCDEMENALKDGLWRLIESGDDD